MSLPWRQIIYQTRRAVVLESWKTLGSFPGRRNTSRGACRNSMNSIQSEERGAVIFVFRQFLSSNRIPRCEESVLQCLRLDPGYRVRYSSFVHQSVSRPSIPGYAWPTMICNVRLRREQRKQGAGEYECVVKSMVEEKATRLDSASQLRNDKEGRGWCKLGCPKQEGLSERI